MAAEDVVNYALVLLGDPERITSLSDNGPTERVANVIYNPIRKEELRAHDWNFARTYSSIAKDGTDPDASSGFNYRYPLPAGFLRLASNPEENFDWEIAGSYILSNSKGPLYVRYIQDVTDTSLWDALFFEAMATRIALKLQPFKTQSNTKKQLTMADYRDVIARAKAVNAIERRSQPVQEDLWIAVRK